MKKNVTLIQKAPCTETLDDIFYQASPASRVHFQDAFQEHPFSDFDLNSSGIRRKFQKVNQEPFFQDFSCKQGSKIVSQSNVLFITVFFKRFLCTKEKTDPTTVP